MPLPLPSEEGLVESALKKALETGITYAAAKGLQPDIPKAGEITEDAYKLAKEWQPQMDILSREKAALDARAALNRRLQYDQPFADQDFRMAEHYSPLYQLLNDLNRHRSRYTGLGSEVTMARGPGGELSREIQSQLKEADPEFYDARAQMGQGYDDLLRSYAARGTVNYDEEGRPMDTGRFTGELSEGERAEIERSLARQGVQTGALTGPRSMSNVVSGAMKFGQGVQGRRDAFSRALASATGFLPASRSGFDPLKTMFGRASSTAPTQFSQPQATGQSTAGSNVFNTAAGVGQTVAGLNAGQDFIGDMGNVQNLFGWGSQNDPWQRNPRG
tara:strand:- start:983 stop:1978 length:996 start_codon:yes stop_codon:yes gene_type:complete